MESNYVMPKISLLAEAPSTGLADARLEARMNPLVSMYTENSIEGLVTVTALKLTRGDFLDLAHGSHFGHLGN